MGFARHLHTNTQDTDGMRRRSRPHQMHNSATLTSMRHNAIRQDLAPHTHSVGASGVSGRHSLAEAVQSSIRRIRRSATGLTPREQTLFRDIAKGRYIGGVLNALEISQQKCRDVTDATALPEAFRGWVVGGHPGLEICLFDSFVAEQQSNGAFDLAQIRYMKNPTKQNRDQAIEAGTRQLVETRRALDALHRDERDGRLRLAAVR